MVQQKCSQCSRFLSNDGTCTSKKCDNATAVSIFTSEQEKRLLELIRKAVQKELQHELKPVKDQLAEALKKNDILTAEVKVLRNEVNDLQQYSRRNNVIITGIPVTDNEDVYAVLAECEELVDVPVTQDIDVAHRLPSRSADKPTSIIVKFGHRTSKNRFMDAWRRKKPTLQALGRSGTSQVYVSDHLSKFNASLFYHARSMKKQKKLEYAWVRDCKIFVKKTARDKTVTIHSLDQLHALVVAGDGDETR